MESITVGIDLAKQVLSVCVMDDRGRVTQRRELKRDALRGWLLQLPAGTVVAMEACSGAHDWGRYCEQHGLVPRLMAAQFVKAYRKNSAVKNDRQDAEAIATAARQGNMRFISVKTVDQQARLSWHRVREGYKKDALAVTNRIRGLLAEFGIVIGQSDSALRRVLADLEAMQLPPEFVPLVRLQERYWEAIEACEAACTKRINEHAEQDERCQRIRGITGVGALTADAIVATLGNGHDFKNGRQCAAWMGLTPGQFGTGGKVQLGKISRRGDKYLRTLLIQGARSSVQRAKLTPADKATPEQLWIVQLAARMPFGKLLVAVANKHARQIWAMLARNEAYDAEAWLKHPMVQRG
jgi:transposase